MDGWEMGYCINPQQPFDSSINIHKPSQFFKFFNQLAPEGEGEGEAGNNEMPPKRYYVSLMVKNLLSDAVLVTYANNKLQQKRLDIAANNKGNPLTEPILMLLLHFAHTLFTKNLHLRLDYLILLCLKPKLKRANKRQYENLLYNRCAVIICQWSDWPEIVF